MARLTVLLGAPGAGKSTYAAQFANVVTNDGRCGTPGETLHSSYRQINELLAQGKDVIFDTTGATAAIRKAAVTIAKKHGAQIDACVLATPVEQCLQAQKGRAAPVAAADVRRIHDSVAAATPKLKGEGFQNVAVRNRR